MFNFRNVVIGLVILSWALTAAAQSGDPPPPPVADPGNLHEGGGKSTNFKHGQITFTQAGRSTTWKTGSGQVRLDQGAKSASLRFSPDGKSSKSYLLMNLKNKDGAFEVSSLRVKDGPSGSAEYKEKMASCEVNVTMFTASGVVGSGSCTGEFKGGPAVSRFQFSARP